MVSCGGVGGGGFGLPGHLIVTFFAVLCRANLKYAPLKSLATKPRIWSKRWRRCWGPSTGTPWWRPARAWGPGSRLLLMLTAVLKNEMILYIYLCKFAFTSIKTGRFSAVLCHLKVRRRKFRIYRCHPVLLESQFALSFNKSAGATPLWSLWVWEPGKVAGTVEQRASHL